MTTIAGSEGQSIAFFYTGGTPQVMDKILPPPLAEPGSRMSGPGRRSTPAIRRAKQVMLTPG